MFNAPYIRVLSKPSASAGGRSSCFGITWTAAERAVTNSVARICIVRDGSIAIPLLLTPGLGRVVTTLLYLCPNFPLTGTVQGTGAIWNVRYVPLSLPYTLEQLSFLNEILIGPDSKKRVFRVFVQGSCRANSRYMRQKRPAHQTYLVACARGFLLLAGGEA